MRFCEEDATVQSAACDCLYNFVHRNEMASIYAEENDALSAVDDAITLFFSDKTFRAHSDRARETLLPDGWRA